MLLKVYLANIPRDSTALHLLLHLNNRRADVASGVYRCSGLMDYLFSNANYHHFMLLLELS